jgi:hypothetical protein
MRSRSFVALTTIVCAVALSAAPSAHGDEPTATPVRPTHGIFSLTAPQAREIAVVMAFLDAYNAGNLDTALAQLTEDIHYADCDFRDVPAGRPIQIDGKEDLAVWLQGQFADHDRLEMTLIFDENPGQPLGVVGVEFGKRTSDSLRERGYPDGIDSAVAKVVFNATYDRITYFINGCL